MLHAVLYAVCCVQHAILKALEGAGIYPKSLRKSIENEVQNLSKMRSRRFKIAPKLIPEVLGGSLERLEALPRGHVASRLIFSLFGGSLLEPCWAQKALQSIIFAIPRAPQSSTRLYIASSIDCYWILDPF